MTVFNIDNNKKKVFEQIIILEGFLKDHVTMFLQYFCFTIILFFTFAALMSIRDFQIHFKKSYQLQAVVFTIYIIYSVYFY